MCQWSKNINWISLLVSKKKSECFKKNVLDRHSSIIQGDSHHSKGRKNSFYTQNRPECPATTRLVMFWLDLNLTLPAFLFLKFSLNLKALWKGILGNVWNQSRSSWGSLRGKDFHRLRNPASTWNIRRWFNALLNLKLWKFPKKLNILVCSKQPPENKVGYTRCAKINVWPLWYELILNAEL